MLNHLIEFLARSHLVVLHFPIALVLSAALVESARMPFIRLSRRSIRDHYRPCNAASIMLLLGSATAVLTTITGLIFGFDGSTRVDLHRILGILSTILVLATAASLLVAINRSTPKSSLIYLCMLISSAAAVSATAHFGGELTHGEGFLTDPLRNIIHTPEPINLQQLNVSTESFETFNTTILPIFQNACIKCHGPKKQKGDIRLDSLAFVLDDDAFIIDRDDPLASELLYRIELPHDDEDAMPPPDKADPLTPKEVHTIQSWLQSLAAQ